MTDTPKKAFSDFWLNKDSIQQYVPDPKSDGFSVDLIHLASYRRLVSNFVYILTKKDIPVQFCTEKGSQLSFTDGKSIYLSASVQRKTDFDWSVGVALHEASHILLSDFDLLKTIFSRCPMPVPQSLALACANKNLSDQEVFHLVKWVWNFIEDRYIDSYTFKEAPGYRGYYKAMYQQFWNNKVISKALKSKAYRSKNISSYEYRVINLTNPNTQTDALPGLNEIVELIEIRNMLRVSKTTGRLDMAYKVAEIIVDNIDAQPKKPKHPSPAEDAQKTLDAVRDKLKEMASDGVLKGKKLKSETDDDDDKEKSEKDEKGEKDKDAQKSREKQKGEMGDSSEFSEDEIDELSKSFKELKDFINHNYEKLKEAVSQEQKAILDAIEKSGIILVPSGFGLEGDYTQASVDCIVVKKMTRELVMDTKTFPYATKSALYYNTTAGVEKDYEDAVSKGFQLGRLLGRKLQIRAEEKQTKFIRKPSGKIERRLLAGIGAGLEDIFSRVKIEKYNKARIHISVDASGSMQNIAKWAPTMTCLVAICVAASMVDNLAVSVSFRSTIGIAKGNSDHPYIVLAYDSLVDKVSKIRTLFPHLRASGGTPEGLAFEAIADEFIVGRKTNEQDHYFLNISDGEPAFALNHHNNKYGVSFDYMGESAALHTKQQVDKIRSKNVKVLSYFISSGDEFGSWGGSVFGGNPSKKKLSLKEQFQLMYGKDGQFIDVENVTDIARTVNRLFLSKV